MERKTDDDEHTQMQRMGPCTRLSEELTMPPFQVEEADGREINIAACFCPEQMLPHAVIKVIILGWATFEVIWRMLRSNPEALFFAYVRNWSLVFTILYFLFSLLTMVYHPLVESRTRSSPLTTVSWSSFVLAAPCHLFSLLCFLISRRGQWEKTAAREIFDHWGMMAALYLEGFAIHNIPVRFNHIWFFYLYVYLYFVWSYIFAYLEIGEMYAEEGEEVEEVVPLLNWEDSFISSAITVVSLLLITPMTFVCVWFVSLYSFPFSFSGDGRKFLEKNERTKTLIVPSV